ncbi:hypothetical protein KEGY108214_14110 [Kerstersia gyiorum]
MWPTEIGRQRVDWSWGHDAIRIRDQRKEGRCPSIEAFHNIGSADAGQRLIGALGFFGSCLEHGINPDRGFAIALGKNPRFAMELKQCAVTDQVGKRRVAPIHIVQP